MNRGAFRRYPALGLIVAAAALAILLPSALNIPQSGPSSLAEFAPVPGSGDGRSDVSALGQPSSGGAGTGRGSAPAVATNLNELGRPNQKRPVLKRCVGEPPRQTEDRLSPPCVPFFNGDNGGATAKGVSGDEVTVVLRGVDATGSSRPKEIDCALGIAPDDEPEDLACKAYMRYFNDRYQTYDRRVHLWLWRMSTYQEIDTKRSPFAAGTPYSAPSDASRRGTVAFGYQGTRRESYRNNAPRFMSFKPDIENEMEIVADYVCRKLARRPARFSGNAEDRSKTRKFAVWYDPGSPTKPDLLIKAVRDNCGEEVLPFATVRRDDITVPGRMRQDGVTTVLISAGDISMYALATRAATHQAWFPEWVLPGDGDSTRIDTNSQGRNVDQAQWANMIGVTFDYRRDAIRDQHWYRAYKEACPSCPEPAPSASTGPKNFPFIYDALNLFFWGVQAAGPRLTPENIDKGLHAIPPRPSPNVYTPAGYFAPGNWSFVKDGMAVWWDPAGRAPGSAVAGCYKLPNEGRRFRIGDWIAGDADAKGDGPCHGDSYPET